ncbi:hypothetical protein AB0M28_39530 [Streptomyces sp. NPDC051940]|uniref:hypothetical protein n=1 Tax=Streptomyces sp. NPDC051940 TaxID=3155675 RepID=UPI00342298A9
MTPDPQEPETFQAGPDRTSDEVPEADAAEQQADLVQQDDSAFDERTGDHANTADAAEQARVVAMNEDDYR